MMIAYISGALQGDAVSAAQNPHRTLPHPHPLHPLLDLRRSHTTSCPVRSLPTLDTGTASKN